jgi:aspartate/methionine/tyrosine aminotransferase
MREAIHNLEASKIREVANAGMGRDDVLAFWFGESDEVTPDVIRQAAIESLQRGETFYAHNLGLPELREAIARYTSARCTGGRCTRIAVTSGGVSALMLAVQALVDAGDEVVAVTPVWPNLTAQPAIMGAQVRRVSAGAGERRLDAGPAGAAGGRHAGDQAADRQCAQQPHGLDA